MIGKKPPPRKKAGDDIPKPTSSLQAREAPLDLTKNLNKTIIVDVGGSGGQKGPGFYCEVCKRTCKDSARYLDHINGRSRKSPPLFLSRGLWKCELMLTRGVSKNRFETIGTNYESETNDFGRCESKDSRVEGENEIASGKETV